MNSINHRVFTPKFEGRTREAIVTSMQGNVVSVRFCKKPKRPPLKSTAVLGSKGRVN